MANQKTVGLQYHCLIVGGGPAGLAAARVLARQRYRVIVFDASLVRHNSPTTQPDESIWHSDHSLQCCEHIRGDVLAKHPEIQVEAALISRVQRFSDGHFEAYTKSGTFWCGRVLLLATGVDTIFPDIPGYQECWASGICSNILHCNCSHEDAASAGVLAIGDMGSTLRSVTVAGMVKRLADSVTIYTDNNESLSEQLSDRLGASPIRVDSRGILKLEKGGLHTGVTIQFTDGTSKTESMIVHEPKIELNGPFALQLGLDLNDWGLIKVHESSFVTSVPSVYAVGDCAALGKAMVYAVATGTLGAAAISAHLTAEMD